MEQQPRDTQRRRLAYVEVNFVLHTALQKVSAYLFAHMAHEMTVWLQSLYRLDTEHSVYSSIIGNMSCACRSFRFGLDQNKPADWPALSERISFAHAIVGLELARRKRRLELHEFNAAQVCFGPRYVKACLRNTLEWKVVQEMTKHGGVPPKGQRPVRYTESSSFFSLQLMLAGLDEELADDHTPYVDADANFCPGLLKRGLESALKTSQYMINAMYQDSVSPDTRSTPMYVRGLLVQGVDAVAPLQYNHPAMLNLVSAKMRLEAMLHDEKPHITQEHRDVILSYVKTINMYVPPAH